MRNRFIRDMDRAVFCITILLVGITFLTALPQKTSIDRMMENGPLSFDTLKSQGRKSQEYVNLLDTEQLQELLAQGKVRNMIDLIQRTLGKQMPFHVRTEWEGPYSNSVRNTINWGAYKGDKTRLNMVVDSKFSRKNGKVDVIDPSFGMNFQLKY